MSTTVGARDAQGRISLWRVETTPEYTYRNAMFDVMVEITNQTGKTPIVVLATVPGGKE